MKNNIHFLRRNFLKAAGLGTAAFLLRPDTLLAEAKKFPIGATFILWGYGADNLEPALQDISKLGFHAFETFGKVIETWESQRGGMGELIKKYKVPLISAFCDTDVLNPAKRKEEIKNLIRWARILKQQGGKVIEYCASGIDREKTKFNFMEHKQHIIASLNDYAKAIVDEGLVCALHPHTGTPIETEEEVYAVMESVNTTYMKFGPDVGQLEKAGCDPVKIVQDFMPLIEHVHLKDFEGGDNGYLGYSPLGEGKVKLKKILNLLEARRDEMVGMIMFELDSDDHHKPARTAYQAAEVSRNYLKQIGYQFQV